MSDKVVLTRKEKIYDELMSPLVAQIIALSEEHGIALALHVDISGPGVEDLRVSSLMPDENNSIPREWHYRPIAPRAQDLAPADDRPNSGFVDMDGPDIQLRD